MTIDHGGDDDEEDAAVVSYDNDEVDDFYRLDLFATRASSNQLEEAKSFVLRYHVPSRKLVSFSIGGD